MANDPPEIMANDLRGVKENQLPGIMANAPLALQRFEPSAKFEGIFDLEKGNTLFGQFKIWSDKTSKQPTLSDLTQKTLLYHYS